MFYVCVGMSHVLHEICIGVMYCMSYVESSM